MLLKFGYGEKSYIKKSEEELNIEEDFAKARYLAYSKLFNLGEFAKSKVKDKKQLSKIEYYSGEISNIASEYESKIRTYFSEKCERLENGKMEGFSYRYDRYNNGEWELDEDFYNKEYNGYQKSWPTEVQGKFEDYLTKINVTTFLGTKVADLIKHIRVLCECIVYGDEAADKDIKQLKVNLTERLKKSGKDDDLLKKCILEEHATYNGWTLLKNKLRHRIESCIDFIERYYELNNQENEFKNKKIREGLISNLHGRFNKEKFEEVYYGKTLKDFYEQHIDFKSRLLFETDVPHNIEFNKNIIDEDTSKKINEAVEELGKMEAGNKIIEEKIGEEVEKFKEQVRKQEENRKKRK